MNLLLLEDGDFLDERRACIRGRRLDHLRNVLRLTVGATVAAGRIGGSIGTAVVEELDEESAILSASLTQASPPPLPLTILLALPRPKVLRRLLLDLASLGVKKIVLLNSYRVEKSYWQSPFLEEESLRRQLVLGLEQGRDTILPEVLLRPRFKPFVEDELPDLATDSRPILAHPTADTPCPRALSGPVTLAVGPEGGFIAYEVEKLVEAGFEAVHLGPKALRVEAVVPFLLGRIVS